VGLFRSKNEKIDPWRDGVSATATIERVHATGAMRQGQGGAVDSYVRQTFMVFRFIDPQGSELIVERELWVGEIRVPGSTVRVAYLPSDPQGSLDYDRDQVRSPDPAAPRGWGAGFFEIESLGSRCAVAPDPALDAERELFRTGRRAQAMVVRHHIHGLGGEQGNLRCTLQLRVDGADIETDVRTFPAWTPNAGSSIQVAIAAEGSTVALDTDERYYGPPGRALVYSMPDPYAAPDAADTASQAEMTPAAAELDQQLMAMKRARVQMGKRYEKTIRKILDGQRAAGLIDDGAYQELLRRALS
jgi:hypothetical protein